MTSSCVVFVLVLGLACQLNVEAARIKRHNRHTWWGRGGKDTKKDECVANWKDVMPNMKPDQFMRFFEDGACCSGCAGTYGNGKRRASGYYCMPDDMPNMGVKACKSISGLLEEEREENFVDDVITKATIPINVEDCGGADHVVAIAGYEPKTVSTGATTALKATGSVSEGVTGGTMNMLVKMTGFPWSTLGEIKNGDFCQKQILELWSGFIYGGIMEWGGFDCPVAAGLVTANIKLTLPAYLPTGLANVKVSIDGKGTDGKPLLCATATTSGR